MKSSTKQVLKFALLPGILPRLRELLTGSFGFISIYLAQIYGAVRLLPPNHPYLNPANIGRFGVANVVAAAAARLRFGRENIDQIAVFFLLLSGLVVLVMQFILLGVSMVVQGAHAASTLPVGFTGFFITANPQDDVAFVILERVFGVEESPGVGFFGSCVSLNVPCFQTIDNPYPLDTQALREGTWPWPFHMALHQMFQFYSVGLLVVALLIFCYFVTAIVLETAQEGTPFGKRFNHVWAPLRMVVALGLLIPITNGLNSAQYITMWVAYWGSGFATNGWNLFTATALAGPAPAVGVNTIMGGSDELVATPEAPEMTNLIEYATVMNTCWAAYRHMIANGNPANPGVPIHGWLVKRAGVTTQLRLTPATDYAAALTFEDYHDIDLRIGECTVTDKTTGLHYDCDAACPGGGAAGSNTCPYDYPDEIGYTKPTCGEMVLPVVTSTDPTAANLDPGGYFMQSQWWELMHAFWEGDQYSTGYGPTATQQMWSNNAPTPAQDPCNAGTPMLTANHFADLEQWGICIENHYENDPPNPAIPLPTLADIKWITSDDMTGYPGQLGDFELSLLFDIIPNAVKLEQNSPYWAFQLQKLGWGGAGVWYNRIANLNGNMIEAVEHLPVVIKYPDLMEKTRLARAKADASTAGREAFRPYTSNNHVGDELLSDENAQKITRVMWQAYDLFKDAYNIKPSKNTFYDAVKWLTGTRGLFALTDPANVNVNPLALLVGVGKSLFDAAIRNLGMSLGGTAVTLIVGSDFHGLITTSAAILKTLGFMQITIGVILYYVVPFMPFLYFFFSVATWVKGIFEAMVGVPLWALAHIHIDGEGLPGSFAMGGYYMLLEIFLRPIAIIFGLLASIIIFAAQVRVLNDIWSLVTSNLTGFNEGLAVNNALPAGDTGTLQYYRDQLDQFIFTCVYAIVVYMLAMSSFKLITLIPAKLMRWLADSVQAFNDNDDIAQGLMGKMTAGLSLATNEMSQTWDRSVKSLNDAMTKEKIEAKDPNLTLQGALLNDAKKMTHWRGKPSS